MPKLRPIQKSFKYGEITPKLRSQPMLAEYNEGVQLLDNFLTSPFGTVIRRTGSENISEVSNTLKDGRLFTFRVEAAESYVISITEDELQVHDRNGVLPVTPSPITNPSFNQGDLGWTSVLVKQSPLIVIDSEPTIRFNNGTADIRSGNAAVIVYTDDGSGEPSIDIDLNPSSAELVQQVSGLVAGNQHSLKTIIAPDGFKAKGIMTDYISLGTTQGANDIAFTIDPTDSANILFTPPGISFWISYKLNWDDSLKPSVEGPEFGTGVVGTSASANIDIFILLDLDAVVQLNVTFPSPWDAQQVKELQAEKAPGQSIMYFVVRAPFTTKKLTFDRTNNLWDFVDVNYVGSTGDPPEKWDDTGYPGSIAFFQGRMFLAGSLGHPTTVWGSMAGEDNYEDFTIGGAADDDALELPLARDGAIVWIQGGKGLHVGTENAEHVIIGDSQGSIIIPSNARTIQQSSYGSYRVHAKWISEKISFISNDQHRVYVGDYNRETLGFLSSELSYLAEHITFPGIIEAAYGQNPRARIWLPRIDGVMVGCTYQRETQAVGFFRHTTPGGLVKSVTVTEEFGQSVPWILVERQNVLHLERFGTEIYLDNHVTRSYATVQVIVDGLEHLEGLPVDVIGDGAYAGRFVVSGGQVTVQNAAQVFVVGIPYLSEMITLPVEVLNNSDNLTAKLVRWNKIYVRLLASVLPKINDRLPPDRTPGTPMDTREPNKSQDVRVSTTGWDRDASINIKQDLPFPCEIVGLYGELSEDGL